MKTTFLIAFAALLTIGFTNPSNAQHFDWMKLTTVNPVNNSFVISNNQNKNRVFGTVQSLVEQPILSDSNQVAVVSAGGSVSNEAGSFSYTLGQVVYTAHSGPEGHVSQGIQQGWEITIETNIPEAKGIHLSVSALALLIPYCRCRMLYMPGQPKD